MKMTINANTKIAPILKQNHKALDAIISINPKFGKLKNPILRKIMAARTSLAAASKIAGCAVDEFFNKLEPLGFEIDRHTKENVEVARPVPTFITSIKKDEIIELDVRPVIASGNDPFNIIMETVKTIQAGQVLKIINTFEPTPLVLMMEKKGFETFVDAREANLVETYFHKIGQKTITIKEVSPASDWDTIISAYTNNIQKLDVRHLEMPQPMLTILAALDELPAGTALYVYHKRIPVFLLPELAQKGFDYRIKEIMDGEVHLLVFKN